MKKLLIICLCFLNMQLFAQSNLGKKHSVVDFHAFYNDFISAQQIRATSVGNVISNKLWSPLKNDQVGLGFSYLKGLTKKIDAVGAIDASFVDYLFQSGGTNGSSKFLLTTQLAVNIKLLNDNKTIVPYITSGAGFSLYNGKGGFYIPAGVGLQFNIFNEAFVFTNAQYRIPLTSSVNYHFNYSVGIGTEITKAKKPKVKIIPPAPPEEKVVATEKVNNKNILINITDEATGLPLPYVDVTLTSEEGKTQKETTDANGKVLFKEIQTGTYVVNGKLNNINSSSKNIDKADFAAGGDDINISLTHNDPRFTLSGTVVNKATNTPEENVDVTATNISQNSINTEQSKIGDGSFNIQLESNSEFTIVGRKASFLSNIEKVSTKGLNRSTTLYLKLELDVQEVTASKNIVLNNINFESGKTLLNVLSSSDLDKLIVFLKDNTTLKLEIQGHTDISGNVVSNNKLSQARANSIVTYLISKGINKNRLMAKGYGSSVPLVSNDTPEGRAQNRRVEMKLVE